MLSGNTGIALQEAKELHWAGHRIVEDLEGNKAGQEKRGGERSKLKWKQQRRRETKSRRLPPTWGSVENRKCELISEKNELSGHLLFLHSHSYRTASMKCVKLWCENSTFWKAVGHQTKLFNLMLQSWNGTRSIVILDSTVSRTANCLFYTLLSFGNILTMLPFCFSRVNQLKKD